MSRFLAPIHFWLYDKIKRHEALEADLMDKAAVDGAFVLDLNDRYPGFDLDMTLEEVIDQGNIHGWLQERIAMTERRRDHLLTRVPMNHAKEVYVADARQAAESLPAQDWTFESIKKAIHQFLLDGMPCDQLQASLEDSETTHSWLTKKSIHAPFWTDMDRYLTLRSTWIEHFVQTLDPNIHYTVAHSEKGLVNTLKKEENA
jgi:hypothetical protein